MSQFDIIANAASILGFGFSLGAYIQARRASFAASQARDYIVIRTLADEFERVCVGVDQLLDFIEHDRFAEAALRSGELTSSLSEIPYRRSPYLSEIRKTGLLNVREQLRIIGEVVSSHRRQPISADQKENILRVCRRVSIAIRENLGIIKGQLDQGVNQ